jgi:hypothetical protein
MHSCLFGSWPSEIKLQAQIYYVLLAVAVSATGDVDGGKMQRCLTV